ncbi:hypothetical protein EDB19DRAFT_1901651 [Suillus lakei]|nr:hypothetical protein EDB19DRAFT_1901651 [Suillus lakei]
MVWFAFEHFAGQTVNALVSRSLANSCNSAALGAQITESNMACTARMDASPSLENKVKLQNSVSVLVDHIIYIMPHLPYDSTQTLCFTPLCTLPVDLRDFFVENLSLMHKSLVISANRAQEVQGVALLTLYAKGFACSSGISDEDHLSNSLIVLIDRLKLTGSRRRSSAMCWGDRCSWDIAPSSSTPFLFLHARSLLFSAVRDLWSSMKYSQNKDMRIGIFRDMDHNHADDRPATTWPLGEILAVRHATLKHSL